jgi:hypothetical protein
VLFLLDGYSIAPPPAKRLRSAVGVTLRSARQAGGVGGEIAVGTAFHVIKPCTTSRTCSTSGGDAEQ